MPKKQKDVIVVATQIALEMIRTAGVRLYDDENEDDREKIADAARDMAEIIVDDD